MSHSCAHARWALGTGYPPQTQCGVCYGCLVRRAAFTAAGLVDASTYLHSEIDPDDQPSHIRDAAVTEVKTLEYAVQRGVRAVDILTGGLPPGGLSLDDAVDVASRGLRELEALLSDAADLQGMT